MALFSKKEDTRYIKEFDSALASITSLARDFRDAHFQSVEAFERNFQKEKSASDIERERVLFERHLDLVQKLKFQSDLLIDEALKILRNETALTEKDRAELRRLLQPPAKTGLKVSAKNR